MKNPIENLIAIIIGIAAIILLAFMFVKGMDKQAEADCIKWQQEATEYVGYYLTEWQAAQCEHYQITVDAPVLKSTN